MEAGHFIDYYELLQISPNAEQETITRVYRILAARFHPDNPHTGDAEKFQLLNKAYQVLGDPKRRAEYDGELAVRRMQPIGVFGLKEFAVGIDGEANRRMGILCLLYNRRRTDPDKPGVSVLELEQTMTFPREHLLFTLWYLKEKDLVRQDGSSDFVITAAGVDWVEEHLPKNRLLYHLLKAAESGQTWSDMPPDVERDHGEAEREQDRPSDPR
ncbi:MAG: DnaJ domain-containing protein [Bryobacteraceae bacterium]